MKNLKKLYLKDSTGKEIFIDLENKDVTQDTKIQANADNIQANYDADQAFRDQVLEQLASLETSLRDRIDTLGATAVKLEDYTSQITEITTALSGCTEALKQLSPLQLKTTSLEEGLKILRQVSGIVRDTTVTVSNDTNTVNIESNADVQGALSAPLTITAKNALIHDLSITDNVTRVTAQEAVSFDAFVSSGTQDRSTQGNANVQVNNKGIVSITNSKFINQGYNLLEIGLASTSAPTEIMISDCEFGDTSNNAVLVFNTADNAVITIKDCKFGHISNAIRLSNRDNVRLTLNVINCDIADVDSDPDWRSVIICQDYTAKTEDDAVNSNRFSPDKIKINFVNCTLRGVRLTEVIKGVGEGKENSLIYVWNSANGYVTDEAQMPEIKVF